MRVRNRKLLVTILLFATAALVFALNQSGLKLPDYISVSTEQTRSGLEITVSDVGNADCILFECGGQNMLIDAGNRGDEREVLKLLRTNGVKRLDYCIATHPHEDHIGSMPDVVRNFEIGSFFMPKAAANTAFFSDMVDALQGKNLKATVPSVGQSFKFGDAECTILSPRNSGYEDLNDCSIVLKVVYGKSAFLFTGDAGEEPEREMIDSGMNLKADVIKLGHHGSKSSTSEEFLDAVAPQVAIITSGKGNKYGHPDEETLKKLEKRNIRVFRSDLHGNINIASDGETINISTAKGR